MFISVINWEKMFPWSVSIYSHDSLDIVDHHNQYSGCGNLRLLKYVQDI